MQKRCTRCEELKLASEFYTNNRNKDKLGHWCKKCYLLYDRARNNIKPRWAQPEDLPADMRCCYKCENILPITMFSKRSEAKSGLRSICKTCDRKHQREWRKNSSAGREYHLKKSYNLSLEDYRSILESQNGVCVICGKEETLKLRGVTKPLHVDHNHRTGKVRGLLCNECNSGLGRFKDNIELLQSAIQYLRERDE